MSDVPFSLRPRTAPPGFPPDAGANQVIYASHINAIRDSVALWPGDVNGQGHVLSNVAFGAGVTLPAHAHAAADVTSGVFATARLGSGAASASVFLRGDGTWAAPAGGGSQTPWTSHIDGAGFELRNAGAIAIGTASPSTKLHVASAVSIDGVTIQSADRASIWFNVTNASNRNWLLQSAEANPDDFQVMASATPGAAPTVRVLSLRSNGCVGVGVFNPETFQFEVRGGRSMFTPTGEPYAVGMRQGASGTNVWIGADSAGDFVVSDVAGAERFRVKQGGNVGIGTASPFSRLSFGATAGNITSRIALFEGADGTLFRGIGMANPAAGVFGLGVYAGGAAPTDSNMALFVKDGGNVGIGTSAPAEQLSLGGYGAIGMATGNASSYLTHAYMSGADVLSLAVNYKRTDLAAGNIFISTIGCAEVYVGATGAGSAIALRTSAVANAAPVSRFEVTNVGGIAIYSLPSTNPGAGTKQIWYDPADGNRVKYSP